MTSRSRYAPREFRSPRTLTNYTVGTAAALGFDPAGGRFVTLCETHHTVLNSRTWQLAIDATHYPDWCEDCQPALVRHP
jgi:hypothetical protein